MLSCFEIWKGITFPPIFIALLVLFILAPCLAGSTTFNTSFSKMDAYTTLMLQKYKETDRVNLLVLLKRSLTPDQLEMLKNIGCVVRSQAGDITTVNIQVGKIRQLTEINFVKFIEFPKPLKIERKED